MRLWLDINKTVEQNAAVYFEKAKKTRKKLAGAHAALAQHERQLEQLRKKSAQSEKAEQEKKAFKQKKEWYEKFRWFISSENFLVLGGRDATTNDILIKKHADPTDIIFHADITGSPFCIIKSESKAIGKLTMDETAQFCASNSRAWKMELSNLEVYSISPEQVTKEAMSGEYLGKGAFMIYGKKNKQYADVRMSIGITADGRVMGAPESACSAHCTAFVTIRPGRIKKSDAAKKIKKILEDKSGKKVSLDSLMSVMPPGDCAFV